MAIGDLVPWRSSRTFGEPLTTSDGVTVVPVTRTIHGSDDGDALGVFVIRGDEVVWSPVVDADRVALIGVVTGLVAATLSCIAVVRRPPWPDLRRQ